MDNQKIILYDSKEKCCGCGACMNVCPKQAIQMVEDEYGFVYPQINEELCIKCGACKKVCAYQNIEETNEPVQVYAAVNTNDEQKMRSASGGIFAALATKVLEDKGVVFGCALEKIDGKFIPHHIAITEQSELCKLQGSKYVQSSTEYTYNEVLAYLKQGRKVLYSGTPCQIAGLKGFLRKDYDNLITIDLICHGVPSAKMFDDYLDSEAQKRKAEIKHYVFRDKKKGWGMNGRIDMVTSSGNEKSIYIPARLASYNTLFLDGLTYRENCYSCKYACENRPGDITIGDYWGISQEHPEIINKNKFQEKDGISCIIANTETGNELCKQIGSYIDKLNSSFEKVARKNGQLKNPSQRNKKREKVLEIYKNEGYKGIEELYKNKYRKQRILHYIFNKLPRSTRTFLKGVMGK